MKKKILALIAALTLLASLAIGASASSAKLSYGLDVIAYNLELSKTAMVGDAVYFDSEDFERTLGVSKISSITVLTLPDKESGVLELSGVPVMKNQIISARNIENLRFVPENCEAIETTFVVGSVSSSQPLAITCRISLIESLNFAPVISEGVQKDMSLDAIAGVSRYSYLSASDPEDDDMIYKIVSYPQCGTIRMIDRSRGYFCYRSFDSYVGEDSFTYIACDKYGNASDEVTVSVSVSENVSGVKYCDMTDHPAHYAALRLAEQGIYVGRTVCSSTYFEPDEGVRRDEFVAMAMMASGVKISDDAFAVTTFADDSEIPSYYKKYIAYASKEGYISLLCSDGTGNFDPSDTVSAAEASLILSGILGYEIKGDTEVSTNGSDVSDMSSEALEVMVSKGIIESSVAADAHADLTRGDIAVILCSVISK